MSAHYLNIEEKHRPTVIPTLANLTDFTTSAGEAVTDDIVLNSPHISLYCLDDASQRAIFVELPPDVDLALAPFIYQMQYDQALRLIAMPYDTFREVAHSLPPVQNLILIFSAARSGSTLMSHVLNALDDVLSLSEPDAASQFIHMRPADGSRDAELSELLDCTVRMLFKPNAFATTPANCAIKFRSEAAQAMDLFHATFPQAKSLYLYRGAVGYTASFYRLFRGAEIPEFMPVTDYVAMMNQMEHYDFATFLKYLTPGATQISVIQQISLMWLLNMEVYQAQYEKKVPVLAVRYEDLNSSREQTLTAIFNYCGLPTTQTAAALRVFEHDSQAGTALAREKSSEGNAIRLTDEQISEIKAILQQHPIVKVADFVVPGTLRLST